MLYSRKLLFCSYKTKIKYLTKPFNDVLLLVNDFGDVCNSLIGKIVLTSCKEASDGGSTAVTIFDKGTQQLSSWYGQW